MSYPDDEKVRSELLRLKMQILKGDNPLDLPYCDFCGMRRDQTEAMVAGIDCHICKECVLLSHDIIFGKHKG